MEGWLGSARLSKPPHDSPMPNTPSASTMASTAAGANSGWKTTPNRLLAPLKSRSQSAWPGEPGNAGCSTRATSLRPASHCATISAERDCRSSRTPRVRSPRRVSQQSSGLAYWPSCSAASRSTRQSASSATVTAPITRSAWPPAYLVSAWIETSAPCSNGWKTWMPQVLSTSSLAPWSCATRASIGTSCTSKLWLPGLSENTTWVFGRISARSPASSIIGA